MKYLLVLLSFLFIATSQAREINSRDTVGGLRVEDPFPNINKSGTTPEDRAEALRIMQELGYGTNLRSPKKEKPASPSEGKN